jgi:hypothetical protein
MNLFYSNATINALTIPVDVFTSLIEQIHQLGVHTTSSKSQVNNYTVVVIYVHNDSNVTELIESVKLITQLAI